MTKWQFCNEDGETAVVSSAVWFDSRDLAMRLLGSNDLRHCTVASPDLGAYRVIWRGNDMGANVKHRIPQINVGVWKDI